MTDSIDLFNTSKNEKFSEFKDAFDSLMKDKINDTINNRKMEIAKTIFNPSEEQEAETEVETEVEAEQESEEEENNAEES